MLDDFIILYTLMFRNNNFIKIIYKYGNSACLHKKTK